MQPDNADNISYASASLPGRKRRRIKLFLCSLAIVLLSFITLGKPDWYYTYFNSPKIYRIGFSGGSFVASKTVEEVPSVVLPPPTYFEFAGFGFIHGTTQEQGLRAAGMVITKQWKITGLAIPMWLPLLISLTIFIVALKPIRLVSVLKRGGIRGQETGT